MVGTFRTHRLLVRPMRREDIEFLVELDSDAEVMRYITGVPSAPEVVLAELESSLGSRWLVVDRSDEFLGWVGAVADGDDGFDIGWRFRRQSWGNGFATEAALGLIDALFEDGAQRVFAQTMAVNQRSRSVMDRVGLHYVRTFHLEFEDPLPGTELGEVEYELTRTTWAARPDRQNLRRLRFVAAEAVTEIFRTAPAVDGEQFRQNLDDIASQDSTPRG